MKQLQILFFFCLFSFGLQAQPWPGPAETAGSDAVASDDLRIKSWAGKVANFTRGPVHLESPILGLASTGMPEFSLGKPDNQVVSLGDGGTITLQFNPVISNDPGPDFAVFENSFSDFFLELATVSVSTNGTDFFAFPSFSETDTNTQIGSFDTLRAENLQGLAGKYRGGFGTPFDLEDLPDNAMLDKKNIKFVRITDVVGSLNPSIGTRDSKGRLINDPYPTPFPSAGFDLDAVGVIHQKTETGIRLLNGPVFTMGTSSKWLSEKAFSIRIVNANGQSLGSYSLPSGETDFSFSLAQGLYLFQIQSESHSEIFKILIL